MRTETPPGIHPSSPRGCSLMFVFADASLLLARPVGLYERRPGRRRSTVEQTLQATVRLEWYSISPDRATPCEDAWNAGRNGGPSRFSIMLRAVMLIGVPAKGRGGPCAMRRRSRVCPDWWSPASKRRARRSPRRSVQESDCRLYGEWLDAKRWRCSGRGRGVQQVRQLFLAAGTSYSGRRALDATMSAPEEHRLNRNCLKSSVTVWCACSRIWLQIAWSGLISSRWAPDLCTCAWKNEMDASSCLHPDIRLPLSPRVV